jgi:hypothetical protein
MLVVLVTGLFPQLPVQAAVTELFFSEYIEGSSNNKALEIFNGTGVAINLATAGYNVQMFFNGMAAAGLTINLTGTVATGDVFVLAHSSAAAAILAQADQTNGAGWFNGNDAVVLRKGEVIIDVIGQIGFDPGPGTEWGSGLTSTADNTLRRKSSVQGGDTNGADAFDPAVQWDGFATNTFDGLGAHTVVVEAETAPSVTSTNPSSGATGVAPNANVTINFSEPVDAAGNWFSISCAASGNHTASQSGGPQSFVLNPDVDFVPGELCSVTVLASQVTDQDADDPPDHMGANHTFSFTTEALAAQIHEIQGASHLSPLQGRQVRTEGVVTARRTAGGRGIWIQDPTGDGNNATSDGVFVFLNAAPAAQIGQRVRVVGTVSEFRGGCADPCTPARGSGFNNLTITQIISNNVNVQVLSSGNPLPAAVVVGTGGRLPPTQNIDDDTTTTRDIEVSNNFDAAGDAIDFYESLEGMLVRINAGSVVVGPTKSFGEITVLPDGGSWATGTRTPRGGILLGGYTDPNSERIQVDDEILRDLAPAPRPAKAMPDMDVGAVVTNAIVGPLDYTFANYKIQATATPTFTPSAIGRESATPPRDQELLVATFNVENLTAADPQAKFDELASLIVNNLKSPDLIGIEEVQDNNGARTLPPAQTDPRDDGTVDASQTWLKLIAAIQTAGGPLYEYRQIDPLNNADGGAPGGNIRVGFLFRTDRGLSFIDRLGGTATTPTSVIAHPSGPRLSFSPGRIDPNSPAYIDTRKSLAAEVMFRGKKVFVIVVHFSSKGDDQPLFGRFQPPTRFSEVARHGQAQVVKNFVNQIRAADPNAYVIVLGDINDFEFSQTVSILEEAGLTTFVDGLPANERYSYVFEGNSQILDQILGSPPIVARLVQYDVIHVNSEFAVQASDHEPSVARINMIGRP